MHAATQFEIARLARSQSSPHFLKFVISVPEHDTQGMTASYPTSTPSFNSTRISASWNHGDYVVNTHESEKRFNGDARFLGGTAADGRAN